MQAIEKLPFIEWLKGAALTTEEGLQVLRNNDANVDPNLLPWKFPVIVQRQCYTKLLGQMQMWAKDTVKRLVISGTPGIGKTTLIYFLLWKFFQKELDYDVVVLGTPSGLISIQKDPIWEDARAIKPDTCRCCKGLWVCLTLPPAAQSKQDWSASTIRRQTPSFGSITYCWLRCLDLTQC